MIKLVVISGFSNSGKDSVVGLLKEFGFNSIVPYTTRPIRHNEKNGESYNFISEEEFLKKVKNNFFVVHSKYNTLVDNIPSVWYYGIQKKMPSNDINIVVQDVDGAIKLKKEFGDDCMTIFLDANVETRRNRNIARGDYNEPEFNRRNEDDEKRYPKKFIKENIDFVIDSDVRRVDLFNEILSKIEFNLEGIN